ncbi:MAG: porin [Candidatus Omnitrophica bacterium]|nr:porin [Candidatus Omnitrophota bacterium]
MKKFVCQIVGICFLISIFSMPVLADENEISALKETIEKLNKRLETLERAQEKPAPTYIAPPGGEAPTANVIEGTLSGVQLTGFVDTAWHWNFNNPTNQPSATTGTREQSVRVFDQDEGSFTIHAVELSLQKPAPETGGVGFRTDLFYGEDAEVITPTGNVIDEFDLQQAYVEANLPIKALEGNEVLGDNLYLRAGKYVTLSGAEVIEAKDNWNTTRSLLFGWAIPFTHTGVRSVYKLFGDKVTVSNGLNNGWDIIEDNNNYSTYEGQIAYTPNDDWLFTATTYIGPENANQDGHKRYLLDFVALWNVTDKLSLMANFDLGNESRVPTADANFETAHWYGFALYAKYQATDKLAFATRGELFVDQEAFRIGAGGVAPTVDFIAGAAVTAFPAREQRYWEWTYTTEYKLYDNLISRLEYRYDWSDGTIFNGESSQQTLSAQLIYNFA